MAKRVEKMFHRSRAALLLALLCVLVACGSVPVAVAPMPTSAPTVTPQVTLRWSVWGSNEELAGHQRVANFFMQQFPNIAIEVDHTPWESYHTNLRALMASDNPTRLPDVLFLGQDFERYIASGDLENLDPWIAQSRYNLDDYWPTLVASGSANGAVFGLQRDLDLSVLYYNKKLFDEAGVAYPTDTWTWDDWAAAAAQLTTRDAANKVVRYGLAMEAGKLGLLLAQNGGSYIDNSRDPSRCTIDQPAALASLDFYTGLLRSDVMVQPNALAAAGGDATMFANGEVAMMVQNISRVPTLNTTGIDYDITSIPIPKGGQRVNNVGGARWVMSSHSLHKAEAWTFLSWLQSADGGQRLYASAGDMFPSLRSVAAAWVSNGSIQRPANRAALLTEASNLKPVATGDFPEWADLNNTIITPGLEQIWQGALSPEQAVTQLCASVDSALKNDGYLKKESQP